MSMPESRTEDELTQKPPICTCKRTLVWRRTNESCLAHQHSNEVHIRQTRQPRIIQVGPIIMTHGP